VVGTFSKSDGELGGLLLEPKVKKIGQADFLVGLALDSGHPDDWAKDRVVWLPIDDIAQIVEFADTDDARKSVGAMQEADEPRDAEPKRGPRQR
jgi:hypothetical protein